MKSFNWRIPVAAATPTVSILHAKWLCLLLHGEWGSHESTFAAVMLGVITTSLAVAWAMDFKG
jgi:hypothetical protein